MHRHQLESVRSVSRSKYAEKAREIKVGRNIKAKLISMNNKIIECGKRHQK